MFTHSRKIFFVGLLILLTHFFILSPVVAAEGNPLRQVFEEGMLRYNVKDFAGAQESFQKALQFYPGFPEAHFYLAMSIKESGGSNDQILTHLEQAVANKPDYAAAHEELGRAYYEDAQFDKAEITTLRALELNPSSVSTKLSLGWIYLLGQGKAHKAVEYFKQVAGENELPYAYLGLGMAYYMNDERLLVMEMITALRKINREDFANQLEAIVRSGPYIQPEDGGAPLLAQKRPRSAPAEELPPLSEHSNISSMPVRIQRDVAPGMYPPQVPPSNVSGQDRIRQLQENSHNINYSY